MLIVIVLVFIVIFRDLLDDFLENDNAWMWIILVLLLLFNFDEVFVNSFFKEII